MMYSMLLVFLTMSVQMPVLAGMIDNQQLSMESQLQMQRDEVRSMLAREDVRAALLGYGVAEEDLDQRISNMTESELLQVHDRLAMLPAGEGALGAVVTILLILIILDVLGVTDIFPRI